MHRLTRIEGEKTDGGRGVDRRQRAPNMCRDCPYLGRTQVTAGAENTFASHRWWTH